MHTFVLKNGHILLSNISSPILPLLRSEGLILETGDEALESSGTVARLLEAVRTFSKMAPTEIQIWTYAWLALPMFKPFVL